MKTTSKILIAIAGVFIVGALVGPLVFFKPADNGRDFLEKSLDRTAVEIENVRELILDCNPVVEYRFVDDEGRTVYDMSLVVKVVEDSTVKGARIEMNDAWAENVTVSEDGDGVTSLYIDMHTLKPGIPEDTGTNYYVERFETGIDNDTIAVVKVAPGMLRQINSQSVYSYSVCFDGLTDSLSVESKEPMQIEMRGCRIPELRMADMTASVDLRWCEVGSIVATGCLIKGVEAYMSKIGRIDVFQTGDDASEVSCSVNSDMIGAINYYYGSVNRLNMKANVGEFIPFNIIRQDL